MSINLSVLLKGHYSTNQNGLILEDSDDIVWEHDGFGHVVAKLKAKPEITIPEKIVDEDSK